MAVFFLFLPQSKSSFSPTFPVGWMDFRNGRIPTRRPPSIAWHQLYGMNTVPSWTLITCHRSVLPCIWSVVSPACLRTIWANPRRFFDRREVWGNVASCLRTPINWMMKNYYFLKDSSFNRIEKRSFVNMFAFLFPYFDTAGFFSSLDPEKVFQATWVCRVFSLPSRALVMGGPLALTGCCWGAILARGGRWRWSLALSMEKTTEVFDWSRIGHLYLHSLSRVYCIIYSYSKDVWLVFLCLRVCYVYPWHPDWIPQGTKP